MSQLSYIWLPLGTPLSEGPRGQPNKEIRTNSDREITNPANVMYPINGHTRPLF